MMQGKKPQQQEAPRRFQAPPSAEEIASLREQAQNELQSQDLRDVIEILSRTGLRLGELRELRWQDIDFESRDVTIKSARSGQVRFVPLRSKVSAILHARRERQPDSDFVLGMTPRTTLDRVARQFRILSGKILGRPLPLYSLRQAFAARLMSAGADVATLSCVLGHSSVATTIKTILSRDQLGMSEAQKLTVL